ncbi:Selenoprotein H [Holothuria leucospilota]|uniref:Selenoprotein H n=1 Tax=Holothuria leucospilota TaxID=206669 RepID=A0A9Q1CD50_HOLLE|nr:Selenoprotein H [Holothuria leucospilota]
MAPTTRAQKREGKEPLPLKAKKPKKSAKAAKAPLVETVTKEEKEEDVPVGNGHPISNGTEDKVADEEVPAPASIEEKNDADGPEEIKDENVKEEQERVYKRNANKLLAELRQEFPGIQSETNPTKPRSKSFECTLKKEDGEEVLIWSGLKKGPPRMLKFPEADVIISAIKEAL